MFCGLKPADGADVGRFAQADSYASLQPRDLNRYAYVYNSPVTFNDPSGHFVGGAIGWDPGTWAWGFAMRESVLWIEPIKEDRLQTLNYCVSLGHFVRDPVNGTGGHSIVLWGGSVQCFPPGAVTRITCQAKINRYISPFSDPTFGPKVTVSGGVPCASGGEDELPWIDYRLDICWGAIKTAGGLIPWHCKSHVFPASYGQV